MAAKTWFVSVFNHAGTECVGDLDCQAENRREAIQKAREAFPEGKKFFAYCPEDEENE